MTGCANLVVLDLQCADPPVLAEFYRQVMGWDVAAVWCGAHVACRAAGSFELPSPSGIQTLVERR